MEGVWWDEIETRGKPGVRTTPKHNLVVTKGRLLLAALMKNDSSVPSGILFHCVGEGDPDWDSQGTPDPTADQTTLVDEIETGGRASPTSIVYLDNDGNPTLTVSRRLRISTLFDYDDLPDGVYIREQGLFGGDATSTKDSGYMIDAINHGRIWKDNGVRITRNIELTF